MQDIFSPCILKTTLLYICGFSFCHTIKRASPLLSRKSLLFCFVRFFTRKVLSSPLLIFIFRPKYRLILAFIFIFDMQAYFSALYITHEFYCFLAASNPTRMTSSSIQLLAMQYSVINKSSSPHNLFKHTLLKSCP